MKESDDLYKLMASLTKAEKRYCRLHIQQGAGREATRSLKLFDTIAALPSYSENALRKKLGTQLPLRHLPAAKNYLYASLLRALRAYHSRQTLRLQVRELIDGSYLLLDKGLPEQAGKLAAKARRIARAHDMFEAELEVKRIEWSMSFFQWHAEQTPETIERSSSWNLFKIEEGRLF